MPKIGISVRSRCNMRFRKETQEKTQTDNKAERKSTNIDKTFDD